MKDVSYKVGACTRCRVRWLMAVIGRNQGTEPKCPICSHVIVQVHP
jgi:hypothetical protein